MVVKSIVKREFKSIHEFLAYLDSHDVTPRFQTRGFFPVVSEDYEPGFNYSRTYGQSKNLLINGWEDMAKRLEKQLTLKSNSTLQKPVRKNLYDVQGFQASVPRYLQGIPTSMVAQKQIMQKQKVITIVKNIGYSCAVHTDDVIENSVKALQIIKSLEAQGLKINLDIISCVEANDEIHTTRVRIKSAGERLNISKIAFPLVNPDMLRRFVFRCREVETEFKSNNSFNRNTYGFTIDNRTYMKEYIGKDDYYLGNFIDNPQDEINNILGGK